MQGQLSRCAMTCYDRLVQKYGPDPNKYGDAQMMSFNEQLEKLVLDAVEWNSFPNKGEYVPLCKLKLLL